MYQAILDKIRGAPMMSTPPSSVQSALLPACLRAAAPTALRRLSQRRE